MCLHKMASKLYTQLQNVRETGLYTGTNLDVLILKEERLSEITSPLLEVHFTRLAEWLHVLG